MSVKNFCLDAKGHAVRRSHHVSQHVSGDLRITPHNTSEASKKEGLDFIPALRSRRMANENQLRTPQNLLQVNVSSVQLPTVIRLFAKARS
jgi:hypothetical protein